MNAVELRNATFGYDGSPVVSDVDLEIGPGEVVAVLGPNGSGKSTLVKGLLGLTERIDGVAEVLGQPVNEVDRARIGYVPQRHTLSNSVRASVAEIVAIGRLAYRTWWQPWRRDPEGDRQGVARALDQVGLGDRAGADVSQLSGGQQRRVLIARALATNPELLILDEPTAGVDQANQRALAEVLARLVRAGTTMLIVTHEVDAVADILTRVVALDHGHLVFDGTVADYHRRAPRSPGHHHHAHSPDPGPRSPSAWPGAPLDPGSRHA